tara:strand:- start:236 stop:397 length:162 start_codon:yes stop_codon:yes gene_type:complete
MDHLNSLDEGLKNKHLKSKDFRDHLLLTYEHKRILVNEKLEDILPQGDQIQSQ